MKKRFVIFNFIFLALISAFSVSAQISNNELKTFDKEGLSFSYPANWELIDQSTAEIQQIKLSLPSHSVTIYVNSPRSLVRTKEKLYEAREIITNRFVENIRQNFSSKDHSNTFKEESRCSKVAGKMKPRTVFYGSYQNQPHTAEVYSTIIQHRFINLVFIGSDKDNKETFPAWQQILDTFNAVTPNAEKLTSTATSYQVYDGILNGKATRLPAPFYPNGTYLRGVRSVAVQVTIDETGKVVAARAQPGSVERIFLPLAEQAAKEARFSPASLCGEPTQVSGIIIYNFDNR